MFSQIVPTTIVSTTPLSEGVQLFGFHMERADSAISYTDDGVPQLKFGTVGVLRLFGTGWTENSRFVLTTDNAKKGQPCEFPVGGIQKVINYIRNIIIIIKLFCYRQV